jgi:chromate reductase
MTILHILGFSGSLRNGSFNAALLKATQELVPESMSLEIYDLSKIPLYNEDIRNAGYPEIVQDFRRRIASSDALLIASPEYNYSFPGVLKNAIDWASRPPEPPLLKKPAAIMGATPGPFGTVRGQLHLRQVCVCLNMLVLNKPEVLVNNAQSKFDTQGRLVDGPTREHIRDLLIALESWVRLLQK